MNSKSTRRQQKCRNQNYLIFFGGFLIFFGGFHFLVWLIMYLALGWLGILFGFLVNIVMDSGVLLSWIWQENKQLYRKVDLQQKKNLFVRS